MKKILSVLFVVLFWASLAGAEKISEIAVSDYPGIRHAKTEGIVTWMVTWTATSTWVVPCVHGPAEFYDEFGQKHVSMTMTLECCWDSETTNESREFDTHENALVFVVRGKKSCENKYDCGLSNWKIKKIIIHDITQEKTE